MDSSNFQKVIDKIRKRYLGDKWAGEETFENIVDVRAENFRNFDQNIMEEVIEL